MTCDHCPCQAICLGWPVFCSWAAEVPADPVKLAHIRHRSALGAQSTAPVAAPSPRPDVRESLGLVERMNACLFRSRDSSCGCSGGRCALRSGALVSHVDCFACLERYPDPSS